MTITEEKAKVYKIMTDIIWKNIFSFISVAAFVWILIHMTTSNAKWQEQVPFAVIEMFLAGTMYKVFSHYFPKKN
jgi:hypothetical protein